jgi:hypothetical protein
MDPYETATFVDSATIQTPMASGIAAFADPEQPKPSPLAKR